MAPFSHSSGHNIYASSEKCRKVKMQTLDPFHILHFPSRSYATYSVTILKINLTSPRKTLCGLKNPSCDQNPFVSAQLLKVTYDPDREHNTWCSKE